MCAKLLQSCLTLCDPMKCGWPGSSLHGIVQARTLEWIAVTISRGSSWPESQNNISYFSCIGSQVLYTTSSDMVISYYIMKILKTYNECFCLNWFLFFIHIWLLLQGNLSLCAYWFKNTGNSFYVIFYNKIFLQDKRKKNTLWILFTSMYEIFLSM